LSKLYDKKNPLFDLVVKSKDHSGLILIHNTPPSPKIYSYKILMYLD